MLNKPKKGERNKQKVMKSQLFEKRYSTRSREKEGEGGRRMDKHGSGGIICHECAEGSKKNCSCEWIS